MSDHSTNHSRASSILTAGSSLSAQLQFGNDPLPNRQGGSDQTWTVSRSPPADALPHPQDASNRNMMDAIDSPGHQAPGPRNFVSPSNRPDIRHLQPIMSLTSERDPLPSGQSGRNEGQQAACGSESSDDGHIIASDTSRAHEETRNGLHRCP